MENSIKEELIFAAASKVHEDWCIQELKAFFERAKEARLTAKTPREAWDKACFKNGTKRNEIWVDVGFMLGHETLGELSFRNFNDFLSLVKYDGLEVKRYVKRTLTEKEKASIRDYKDGTGEENILKSFKDLSADSKKENLDAAIGALNVYEEMSKAGISVEEMENDPEIKNQIGIAIHTDWLKRNMDHPNESLKVPYSDLDDWTKQQDLTVFGALLSVVKQNKEHFQVSPVEGFNLPDYEEEEKKVLGISEAKGK